MSVVKVAFQDCTMIELEAMASPLTGLASRCQWPPTLYDIASFRKEWLDKRVDDLNFSQRYSGIERKSLISTFGPGTIEIKLDSPPGKAWVEYCRKNLLALPRTQRGTWWFTSDWPPGYNAKTQIASSRGPIRKPFRPFPKLWEAFADDAEATERLNSGMSFNALFDASKALAMYGKAEARTKIFARPLGSGWTPPLPRVDISDFPDAHIKSSEAA